MKIGFDFTDLAVGGAQTQQSDLLLGLKNKGYDIFYTVRNSKLDHPTLVNKLNKIKRVSSTELNQICEIVQVDGYQKQYEYTKPIIETIHSPYGWSIAKNHKNISVTVCISKYLQKFINIPSKLIYNGVCFDSFPKQQTPPKDFTLGFLGRLHPAKNPLLFLDIGGEVPFPHKLLIIGGNAVSPELEKEIKQRIKGKGEITGFVDRKEVPDYLHKCSCLVVPSKYEGFGLMALEAILCGIPVVANNCGGLPEIVTPGNGYLAEYNNIKNFVKKITKVKNEKLDPKADEKFNLDYMIAQYEKLYLKNISGV